VSTGEVVTGDLASGQRLVTGDAVNVAARLEQNAPPMHVLVGESTYRLARGAVSVEELEPVELKGKAQRVRAYRLIDVRPAAEAGRRTDTPMVGRIEELAALSTALESSVSRRAAELVTVLAPAGSGKSRLLQEFIRRSRERATVVRGRCLSYGEGITFWPVAAIARDAAGIADTDSVDEARSKLTSVAPDATEVTDRIASVMGLSSNEYPVQETFWAVRLLLEIVAASRPLVVVIDDIHWAEPTLLDLIEHLLETLADAPVLLLCTARPELLEHRPEWSGDRPSAQSLSLQPLTAAESADVMSNLLGENALSEDVRRRIVAAAEGNPLYVEQMLSMLIDDGAIDRGSDGRWVVAKHVDNIAVPPSIGALLTERLDRLPPVERTVIERGAVIGATFDSLAVAHLCPEPVKPDVPPSLAGLVRREFLNRTSTAAIVEEEFHFVHALVRDAAYSGLLKRTRAQLHESFAGWLETNSGDRLTERQEILGYHLEQSYLSLRQLGPPDRHAVTMGLRASGLLGDAGERARARGDMPAVAGLDRRAAALLPDGHASRPMLLLHAGEALAEIGRFDDAGAVLIDAAEAARACGDTAMATTASVARLTRRFMANPESAATAEVVAAANQAIAELQPLEGHAGLARAWRLLMYVHFIEANFGAAETAARRAVDEADLGGDRVLEVGYLAALASCVLYSPTPVADAIQQCEQVLERAGGDRRTVAMTFGAQSQLEAMRGNFVRARELYGRSRAMLTELGLAHRAAIVSTQSGPVEMLAGDLPQAEAELRRDYAALLALGDRGYLATVAGLLADVLHAQGRYDEAERFATTCRDTAAPEDVAAQYYAHALQAKLAAAGGRLDEAEALAHQAVRLIRTTDMIDLQGDALVTLAEVLRTAGNIEAATAALQDAAALYEQKGNIVSARRAHAALTEITGVQHRVAV
jgi:tetratricopeptide (TPR) repeat protein